MSALCPPLSGFCKGLGHASVRSAVCPPCRTFARCALSTFKLCWGRVGLQRFVPFCGLVCADSDITAVDRFWPRELVQSDLLLFQAFCIEPCSVLFAAAFVHVSPNSVSTLWGSFGESRGGVLQGVLSQPRRFDCAGSHRVPFVTVCGRSSIE